MVVFPGYTSHGEKMQKYLGGIIVVHVSHADSKWAQHINGIHHQSVVHVSHADSKWAQHINGIHHHL